MGDLILKIIDDIKDHEYDVVQFHGELDTYTIPKAEKIIGNYVKIHATPHLIFDLSDLHFVNSSGLGFFVETHAKLAKAHKELMLCGARPNVHDIFVLIGLEKMVRIFPSISEAIAYIKKHK